MSEPGGRRLAGCTVVVTRAEPGALAESIEREGGEVLHVPLITTADPIDGGAELDAGLADLSPGDWLVVTSPQGAARVGRAAAADTGVRLAAVGTATADRLASLAGRPVDLVPDRQTGADLADLFVAANDGPRRVLLAVADRAGDVIEERLGLAGHDVRRVTAYRTLVRHPDQAERAGMTAADAVMFTSGSAAEGWVAALDDRADEALPPLVVAIGPTTADAARRLGLKVDVTATDHSLTGIVDALCRHWRPEAPSPPPPSDRIDPVAPTD